MLYVFLKEVNFKNIKIHGPMKSYLEKYEAFQLLTDPQSAF